MIARLLALLLLLGATAPALADPPRRILVMLRLPPFHFRSGASYGGNYGDDQSRGGRKRTAIRIAHQHGLTLTGNWPMPVIGIDCFIFQVPPDRTTESVVAEIAADPGVEWAQPINVYRALEARSDGDPLLAAQPTARAWRLHTLHKALTGKGVRIAVIDSQIEASHPDLSGQIAIARDFVDGRPARSESHGTGVAGIIAAKANNGIGIAGIAPSASLLALRACWQRALPATPTTICDSLSLAKAIAFAVEQHSEIINLSLTGPADRLLATLLRAAMLGRVKVVAAYDRSVPDGGFPASLAGVIAIADGPVGSTQGPYWAPGADVPTTQPGGRWSLVSGSSYSAAEVSGLLALLAQRGGKAVAPSSFISARLGGGEIDACATLLGRSLLCDNMRQTAAR